jgi:Domain of unknown function (DUF1942)
VFADQIYLEAFCHLRLKVSITAGDFEWPVAQMSNGAQMKITTMMTTAVAIVCMATIAFTSAPIAKSASPVTGKLGSELTMTDSVGQVQVGWTVGDLKSSTDAIQSYPVAGQLWEATATVRAISGPVTPAISQFNARTASGVDYRVLWQAAGPNTISGATIPQGAQATGKIYFDVTGPSPTTVTMNNGMEDLLVWGP